MIDSIRPFLAVYVVWHPGFTQGLLIAEALRQHFRRNPYENVAGGTGLSVIYRFAATPDASGPLPIGLDKAETTAVIVLTDSNLVADANWTKYVQQVAEQTEATGLGTRIFPVAIEAGVLGDLGLQEQALRWDNWTGTAEDRCRQLITELA